MSKQLVIKMNILFHCQILWCAWERPRPQWWHSQKVRGPGWITFYISLWKNKQIWQSRVQREPWRERYVRETGGCVWWAAVQVCHWDTGASEFRLKGKRWWHIGRNLGAFCQHLAKSTPLLQPSPLPAEGSGSGWGWWQTSNCSTYYLQSFSRASPQSLAQLAMIRRHLVLVQSETRTKDSLWWWGE